MHKKNSFLASFFVWFPENGEVISGLNYFETSHDLVFVFYRSTWKTTQNTISWKPLSSAWRTLLETSEDYSPENSHVPWKSIVGRCISYWNSPFLGDELVSFQGWYVGFQSDFPHNLNRPAFTKAHGWQNSKHRSMTIPSEKWIAIRVILTVSYTYISKNIYVYIIYIYNIVYINIIIYNYIYNYIYMVPPWSVYKPTIA